MRMKRRVKRTATTLFIIPIFAFKSVNVRVMASTLISDLAHKRKGRAQAHPFFLIEGHTGNTEHEHTPSMVLK